MTHSVPTAGAPFEPRPNPRAARRSALGLGIRRVFEVVTLISCAITWQNWQISVATATAEPPGRLPAVPGQHPYLTSISCLRPATCWAIGQTDHGAFALHLSAGRWTYAHVPAPKGLAPVGNGPVPSLSCVSDSDCWAATGTFADPATAPPSRNVVFHWNGSRWSLFPAPSPRATRSSPPNDALQSTACPTTSTCLAVGYLNTNQMALRLFRGRMWRVTHLPTSPPIGVRSLVGVTCVTERDCWAVGARFPKSGVGGYCGTTGLNYILHWDGRRWSDTSVPSPSRCTNGLNAVACASAKACWAVGGNDAGIEALQWTGRSWRTIPIPSPVSMPLLILNDMACPDAHTCWAVGEYSTSSGSANAIFEYSSHRWRVPHGIPQPPGGINSLQGVACGGPTSCWAVGNAQPTGKLEPEVIHWNGVRWSLVH